MVNGALKKTIFLSFLGHLTAFGIFSFSFGYKIPPAALSNTSFWGRITPSINIIPKIASLKTKEINIPVSNVIPLGINNNASETIAYYSKPNADIVYPGEKLFVMPVKRLEYLPSRKEAPGITLHPVLPYSFLLFFKDREVVHMEFMFNLSRKSEIAHPIILKRKISSGNLEADLLSMRYIGHYLFIEQARLPENKWQDVKIELSVKND